MKLENKVAIITGASSGIGEATAKLLAAEGSTVVLTARRVDKLKSLEAEINKSGGKALAIAADVTKLKDLEKVAKETLDAFGQIDILVNNAGLMPLSFVKNLHVAEWDQMIDVNIKGVMYGVAAVLPTMMEQKSGHIINISSLAGRKIVPSAAVYCATKFAVTAFSEGLRAELTPEQNIRVSVIEPGAVATELTTTITDGDVLKNILPFFTDIKPLQAVDIAEAILYAVTRPKHVNVNEILILPTAQS